MTGRVALYSAVDEDLTHYEVDVESASLARRKTAKAPAHIQYAWPHPSRRYLYVATSNRGPGLKADFNHVSAFRIDPASGELAPHGEPQALPHRAVHICVDATGGYVLSAHNAPRPDITVTRINPDGTLGAHVPQAEGLDYGTYPHQVRCPRRWRCFGSPATASSNSSASTMSTPAPRGRSTGWGSSRWIDIPGYGTTQVP